MGIFKYSQIMVVISIKQYLTDTVKENIQLYYSSSNKTKKYC